MRNQKLLATLFLMTMLVFTLQAQNHHNNGNGNSGSGNYQPAHPENNHNYQPISAFKGILVKCDADNDHADNWNNDNDNNGNGNDQDYHHNNGNNNHPNTFNNDAYGIVLNGSGHNGGFHKLDARGNELVQNLLRNHRNIRNRVMVQVKGSLNRDGSIRVTSLKWIGRPATDTHAYASYYDSHNNNHRGWFFDLFVNLH